MEKVVEKWISRINEVTVGATKESGGTRSKVVKVGGAAALPFMHFEGEIPNRPAIAMEVWDMEPPAWPAVLKDAIGDAIKDPVAWAKRCEKEFGADIILLRLASAHPENKDAKPEECAETIKKVLGAVGLPLIILGCGQIDKDNSLLLKATEAAKGENCLIGIATKDNYRTVAAACMSAGHSIIAETPIDINLAKQLNILISDMGFPPEKICIHHATGPLGYGFEYTYSIMERTRIAALSGDKMLAQPMINLIGQEVWKTKEAKSEDIPQWGDINKRAILWEAVTAAGFLQSGADILAMCHPEAVKQVKKTIDELMKKGA